MVSLQLAYCYHILLCYAYRAVTVFYKPSVVFSIKFSTFRAHLPVIKCAVIYTAIITEMVFITKRNLQST